jgi:hypothetical protein
MTNVMIDFNINTSRILKLCLYIGRLSEIDLQRPSYIQTIDRGVGYYHLDCSSDDNTYSVYECVRGDDFVVMYIFIEEEPHARRTVHLSPFVFGGNGIYTSFYVIQRRSLGEIGIYKLHTRE